VDQLLPVTQLGAAGSAARAQFITSLNAVMPQGATPTHDALKYGIGALAQSTAAGRRFAVLITDGQPTFELGCVSTGRSRSANPDPIVAEVAAAAAQGISTFVIGSPGSEEGRA
jgi:Mg-chelatase subunit ChlD